MHTRLWVTKVGVHIVEKTHVRWENRFIVEVYIQKYLELPWKATYPHSLWFNYFSAQYTPITSGIVASLTVLHKWIFRSYKIAECLWARYCLPYLYWYQWDSLVRLVRLQSSTQFEKKWQKSGPVILNHRSSVSVRTDMATSAHTEQHFPPKVLPLIAMEQPA